MAAKTEYRDSFLEKLNTLFVTTNLPEGVRDEIRKEYEKSLAEQHRNTRHVAVEKMGAIIEDKREKLVYPTFVEGIFNELTGTVFNLPHAATRA